MGPAGSENWHAMLDGAEDILREEGHAELTSRRVAERIGVKQRLIYYYFRTMDDLVVEMFQRSSEREIARLRTAAASEMPMREIWDVCIHTTDARLITEFMALAARIEGLRKEVILFIEESRRIQIEAIASAARRSEAKQAIPPDALALLATSLALSLTREEQIGIDMGHETVRKLVEAIFDTYEPRS
ncbi:MAG: TetR/AcrR family transcriptional regulator [Novosphingobium sp.]|nr:TetR/AcrR family transcriptional regulator [Novosphingobium sp.]